MLSNIYTQQWKVTFSVTVDKAKETVGPLSVADSGVSIPKET